MMKKKDKKNRNEIKEFSENDVKNIINSIDESNGFGVEFAIKLYRSSIKQIKTQKQSKM